MMLTCYVSVQGGEVPLAEMFGTFALSVGAAVSSITFFLTMI